MPRPPSQKTGDGNKKSSQIFIIFNTSEPTNPVSAKKPEAAAVDKCWWVAVLAFIVMTLQAAPNRCSGFLMVGIIEEMNVSRGLASWPVSLIGSLIDCGGLFSGPLSEVFTTVPVLVGGSALAAVGMIASAFVPDITWLTVTLGVIHGMGLGIVTTMLQVLISMYFERYRGAANGSMFAGYTASAFIFPKLLLYFSDAYGFRGSLLLFGGILLNMAAVSLAFREPSWICCERTKPRKDAKDPRRPSLTIANSNIGTRVFPSKDALGKLQGVLKCRMMYILVVTWIVFSYNGDVFLNTIVDFAMDKGLSVEDAVSITTYTAVTDIVGRTFLPCLVDWRILPQSTLMSLDYFLLGLSAVSLSFCQSYWTLLTACLCLALFVGCAMTMQSVLMAHYLALDKLSVGYTVLGAMSAPAFLAKAAFVGFFRDDLGSYNEMFWVLGSSSLFVSVLWVFVSLDDRKSTRRWEPNDVHVSRKPNT